MSLYILNAEMLKYVPGLPPDTRSEDVTQFFEGLGRTVDIRVMTGSSLQYEW